MTEQKIWFTSDYHLAHDNIRKYCDRPFESIEIMDQTIISNHNSTVNPQDLIYFLGDLTFSKQVAKEILAKLNGRFYFVFGNHDKHIRSVIKPQCIWTGEQNIIRAGGQKFTLNHFPLRAWDSSHHGALHCHGHCHGSLPPIQGALDVGIDNAYRLLGEYRPFSLEEAIELSEKGLKRQEEVIYKYVEHLHVTMGSDLSIELEH